MKQSEWVRLVGLWAGIWPNRPLPPTSVDPWFQLLADLDGQAVRAALLGWAADPGRSWPPQSPGELRSQIDMLPDWTDALARLVAAIRRHGRWEGKPDLDDPALDAVVASFGGWTAICTRFDPTDPTTRAQFRDAYRTVGDRIRHDDTVAAISSTILPALTEGRNDG